MNMTVPAHLRCVAVSILMVGCATGAVDTRSTTVSGSQGPLAWDIVDIGQLRSLDGQRMRWSYTIVLKETAGSAIELSGSREVPTLGGSR